MTDRGKRPKPGRKSKKKLAEIPPPTNDQDETPTFCLGHLAPKYGVSALEQAGQAAFAQTLEQRSRLTWQQIAQSDRHGQGTELLPINDIKAAVPDRFSDQAKVMIFRYHGKKPMVGVRVGSTFHVLWIEKTFGDLYDHG